MAPIKVKSIVSCNSEDPLFPAKNLLAEHSVHKWKCLPQEKQAVAVVQLAESARVTRVDIGNEHSAFIELLVGRSTSSADDNYQVLLPASSFMNPNESRNGRNTNRVRTFNENDLEVAAVKQNWDRVKVICTQPFVKNVQYGLSFLRLSTVEQEPGKGASDCKSLGAFDLVEEDEIDSKSSDDPSAFQPGSMFKKRRSQIDQEQADASKMNVHPTPLITPPSTGRHTTKISNTKAAAANNSSDRQPEAKRQKIATDTSADKPSSSRNASSASSAKTAPFNKLLNGVVFVLSGFQNPYRGDLRQKGIDMGASYRPDWDRQSTHLVCAIANTPKYKQVKGRGKIVRRDWLLDCHKRRQKLSWRKYALDPADENKSDSEEEISVEEIANTAVSSRQADEEPETKTRPKVAKAYNEVDEDTTQNTSTGGNDPDFVPDVSETSDDGDDSKSGSDISVDTDEEVNRIASGLPKKKHYRESGRTMTLPSSDDRQSSAKATSSKTTATPEETGDLPALPDFFEGAHFLLFGDFTASDRKQIVRFIKAFGGDVKGYMGPSVTHVITRSVWNDDFDEAMGNNPKLKFASADWILDCGKRRSDVDVTPYLLHKSG